MKKSRRRIRKKVKAAAAVWAAVGIAVSTACYTPAVPDEGKTLYAKAAGESSGQLQNKIDKAEMRSITLQNEKEKLRKKIRRLEKNKSNVKKLIKGYDRETGKLQEKIDDNTARIKKVRAELKSLRKEMKRAREKQKDQYDTMVKRIQYMYENQDPGYLEVLLSSGNISEFLNNVEYVERISSYDSNMIKSYQQVTREISSDKEEAENKYAFILQERQILKGRKQSLNRLMKKKTNQIHDYENAIQSGNDDLDDYEGQIAAAEDSIEKLLAKQRDQIAAEVDAGQDPFSGTGIPSGQTRITEASPAPSGKSGETFETGSPAPGTQSTPAAGSSETGSSGSSRESGTGTGVSGSSAVSATGFAWPLPVSGTITSTFGYRKSPTAGASTYHKGIDIAVPSGTHVLASRMGKVVTAAYSSSAGNYIGIYHGSGIYTYYMHCSKLAVKAGDIVSQGQIIGYSGSTGVSTGPHLHFAVFVNGNYVNPLLYVSR